MYAKINYAADVVNDPSTVLAGLKALLLGETVPANLPGTQNVGSFIDTSYTTVAYFLYDEFADTLVFRIPVHDDPLNQFVYLEMFVYSSTQINFRLNSTWDAVSHVGTGTTYYHYALNILVNCTSYASQAFSVTISVTGHRHMIIRSDYNVGYVHLCRGFLQWDRGEAWDTIGNGKKPFLQIIDSNLANANYVMDYIGSDGILYSLSSAKLYLHTRYGSGQQVYGQLSSLLGDSSPAARGLNASLESIHNMYEFGVSWMDTSYRFLTGKVADMYLATYEHGAQGDTLLIEGATYLIWEMDDGYRLAVRKG